VVAHELAHVARRHVLKGSAWAAALLVPAALLCFAVVGWRTGFGAAGRDEEGADLVLRRLAVVAATAAVLSAASAPLGSWISRDFEREADWRGLLASRNADAAIGLQQGLVKSSLGVPDPPEIVQVWFGTHPDALDRIGLALRYQSGER
jgi:STE24 endopeptidase